jgi:hypothetical protein
MSYQITWSEGTKEKLQTALRNIKPGNNREWFIDRVTDYVTQEIALYPQDAAAEPGQCVTGEVCFGAVHVLYEIWMDRGLAIIKEIKSDQK